MTSSTASDTKKRLALAISDFLQTSLTDGTLNADEDRESIEVATSCIGDAFKVDPNDKSAVAEALGSGQNLLSIYSVYEKLRGKSTPNTSEGGSSATEGEPSTPTTGGGAAKPASSAAGVGSGNRPNPEAESLKSQGNAAMQQKKYQDAVDLYTQAITISPSNPIYLSNRAAAYSAVSKHDLASADAELAVASDPKYSKAWSRLGLAKFALGDAQGSMDAYKAGIDAEGNGGSETMRKGYETAKKKVEGEDVGSPERSTSPPGGAGAGGGGGGGGGMPDLGSLASMLGGAGGGGGGGGMPDLSEMMNNPMMRQMAQNVMQNPEAMNNLMNNPQLRNMMGGGGSGGGGGGSGAGGGGGGMPDIGAMMNDPQMREMAMNFLGGGGRGGGGAGGAGGGGGGA